MKETYYFSHDYNARSDEKIIKLVSTMGWEGYGLYWAIIEKLYEAGGFLTTDYDCLAFDLRTDSERIAKVIESDLFVISNGKLHSNSVLARLRKRKGKSELARQSALKRWNKPYNRNANALPTQSEGNAIKEIKGKERKDIGEITPSAQAKDFFDGNTDKIFNEFKEKLPLKEELLKKEFQKFIIYWTERNKSGTKQRWQQQPTFEVKRRLATWLGNLKDYKTNNNQPNYVL